MRASLLIVSFLVLALAAACGSESTGGPPPKVAEARAERDVADGAAKLSSTLTETPVTSRAHGLGLCMVWW